MKALKKKDLYVLKAAINGFSEEARRIRKKEIHPNSFEKREQGWSRKRSLGLHARFHMLAYAFMLGKRYDDLEKNRPLFFNGWQSAVAADEILAICKMYGGYRIRYGNRELTQEAVLHWFKTGENLVFKWEEPKVVGYTLQCKVVSKTEKVA